MRLAPELRWFWSVTVYVNPMLGITRSGRAPSLEAAKAQFLSNWQKVGTDSTQEPRPSTSRDPMSTLRMLALPAGFVAPCLPTRAPRPPSGAIWLHEIKWDGFRVIARKEGKRVRLYSRPGNDPATREMLQTWSRRSVVINDDRAFPKHPLPVRAPTHKKASLVA